MFFSQHLAHLSCKSKFAITWPQEPLLLAFSITWGCHYSSYTKSTQNIHPTIVVIYIYFEIKVSLKTSFHTCQTKRGRVHARACAVYRQAGYTAPWRVNRTLPVPARAQLRTFFSNIWRDWQGTGQMHLSTR